MPVNKDEWKLQHSANRRMYQGLFAPMREGEKMPTNVDNFKVASDMMWRAVECQHPSFKYALQPNRNAVYSIATNRWAIKHNTTAFNAIRERNYINKIQRQLEK